MNLTSSSFLSNTAGARGGSQMLFYLLFFIFSFTFLQLAVVFWFLLFSTMLVNWPFCFCRLGAIMLDLSLAVTHECNISLNNAKGDGGGLFIDNAHVTFYHTVIA